VALVKIRWAWIAFPAFLILASFLSLLMSMWQTQHSNVYAWKDSSLALLALGLATPTSRKLPAAGMNVPGELNRRVGDKRVYLSNEDGEWKLKLFI
jgi:hypothetical protein